MPILVLEDGSRFTGTSFGAAVDAKGEVVFSTGMVGYPESLTDPSYQGQILVLTYPLIGNYGIPDNKKDRDGIHKYFESDSIHIKGLIVSEYSEDFNHWQAKKSLDKWLKEHKVPGITGLDTRALTKHLREKGVMLGKIISDEHSESQRAALAFQSNNTKFYDPNLDNLVGEVSIKKPKTYKRGKKTVICIDCGVKNNSIRNFLQRDITVIRVPWNYDFFTKNIKFDGIFISNGPGDPALITETHAIVRKCLKNRIPTFGICLGNQLMAIAAGGRTYKLRFGHRAQNQPCMDLETNRCYITTQNHGFAVDQKSLPKDWKIWFINVNDGTVEGIKHKKLPFMAVQFHPEHCPGPRDTEYLFDEFAKML